MRRVASKPEGPRTPANSSRRYEKASDSFPRGSIMLNPQIIASECEKDVGGEKYVRAPQPSANLGAACEEFHGRGFSPGQPSSAT